MWTDTSSKNLSQHFPPVNACSGEPLVVAQTMEADKSPDYLTTEIQALRIANICLLGLPGEVSVEVGWEIRKRAALDLRGVVCWDTNVKQGDTVTDVADEACTMMISEPSGAEGSHTKYFLDRPKRAEKIEVYVLKDYLREKYGIEFRPRSDKTTIYTWAGSRSSGCAYAPRRSASLRHGGGPTHSHAVHLPAGPFPAARSCR